MRTHATIILLGLLVFSGLLWAQDDDVLEELRIFCEQTLCRGPVNIIINVENGGMFQTYIDTHTPIVQNDWVSLFPGETIYVEADITGNTLSNLRAVDDIKNPDITIEFKMWQEPDRPDIFLTIKNPFNRSMKYNAVMMNIDSEELFKTSSCPVLSDGRMAFEHWPHPIFQLLLFNFRLIDIENGEVICEF